MAANSPRQRRDLLLILASRALRNFAAGSINVAVGLYMYTELHYSLLLIGTVFGAASLSAPPLTLLFGLTSDVFGRKKMFATGNSLLALSTLIVLATTSYHWMVLASALGGFGIAGTTVRGGVGGYVAPMQNALLAEKAPPGERTRYLSLASLVGGVSASLGAFLANLPDYKTLFAAGLALALAATLLAAFIRESENRKPSKEFLRFNSWRSIAKFSATGAVNGFGQGLVTPYFSVLFKSHYNMSNGLIGDIMGAATLAAALTVYFTPHVARRLGFVKTVTATRGVGALLLALFPFAPNPVLAAADYFCLTALRAISMPAQQSLLLGLVAEDERGAASSINQASRLLPSSAGTLAAGYLFTDSFGLPFLLSLPVNMLNILLYNVFFKKDERAVDL